MNRFLLNFSFLITILFVLSSACLNAQNRFWVADVPANWNSNNWANNSNGAPDGGGPPTALQNARFDANGNGNCTLDIASINVTDFIVSNYTSTIEFNGNSIAASGNVTLSNGILDDNSGGSQFNVNSVSGNSTFNGAEVRVRLNVNSNDIELDGSRFTQFCRFEKTGTGNNNGNGGNVFMDSVLLIHSGGANNFLLGNGNPDTFNDFVSMTVTSDGRGYFSHAGSGHFFNGPVEVSNTGGSGGVYFGNGNGEAILSASSSIQLGAGGFDNGLLYLRNLTKLSTDPIDITTTSLSRIEVYDCNFNGKVDFISPRITTRGTNYQDSTSITKTGVSDDVSAGGNHFMDYTHLINASSDYLMMGNGSPDSFDLDLEFTVSGEDANYLARSGPGHFIGGDFIINHAPNTGTGYFYVAEQTGSTLQIDGNVIATNNGASNDGRIIFGDRGTIIVNGNADFANAAVGNISNIQIANNGTSSVTINGVTRIVNSGGISTGNTYLGNNGSVILGDSLYIHNSSAANNSLIYCNNGSSSTAAYGGDIVLENTNAASDGIYFGASGGTATLASNQTISNIGSFSDGNLILYNFTQVGATDQLLSLGGTSTQVTIRDCAFGGSVNISAPNINTRDTEYSGNLILRKTGGTNDNQAGGNSISGTTLLTNIGSGYWLWGNGTPDSFNNNVTIIDSSSSNFYLAYNSTNNFINGDLTVEKYSTGTNTTTYVCDISGSNTAVTGSVLVTINSSSNSDDVRIPDNGSLSVGGDFTIINNATANSSQITLCNEAASLLAVVGDVSIAHNNGGTNMISYLGNTGSATIGGDLTLDNNITINNAQLFVANGSTSNVSIGGKTNVTNAGSGTTRRTYLGNSGSVSFGDSLVILNNTDANNSEVFLNNNSSSTNSYHGPILLESTSADCDGVFFGNSQGQGTLAAGLTISISPNGFLGQNLRFRNFTQVGNTSQTLNPAGPTTYFYLDSASWGGDIDFSGARMYTRDSRFMGTAILEKTGSGDDQCPGGNVFEGNTILNNSGDNYLMMGNGNPDSFLLDLTMNNSGSDYMYFAQNSANNYIGGNFIINNTASNPNAQVVFSNNASSTTQIDGNATLLNAGTAANNYIYFPNQGSLVLDGDLNAVNSSNGNVAQVLIADNVNSSISIGGKATVVNSGMNATTTRVFLGDNGDISIGDSLIISNSSNSTNSDVFVNYEDNSVATFNGPIVLESEHADCDGITFGESGGSATLAAGNTVSIGSGGFISGDLLFYQFTQVGPTIQTLLATGTANMEHVNSSWGGNVDFSAPRMETSSTRYAGTVTLSKTGSIDDFSNGGNYFTGNTVLNNSGDGYMLMGGSANDTFALNLTVNNTGSSSFYIAHNSQDNWIGGDLDITHTPSGTTSNFFISNNNNSSLTIAGNVTINSAITANNGDFYFANNGAIDVGGDLSIDRVVAGNTSELRICEQVSSSLIVGGKTEITISGFGNNSATYIGHRGDITFNDSLIVRNGSSANNSEVLLAHEDSSIVYFNGDILIESTDLNGDGFRFSAGQGRSELADGQRIVIGPNGFIAGNLHFYNFYQIGNTAQTLTTTGDSYIYNLQSRWEADLSLNGGRNRTDDSYFGGDLYFEKTGTANDQSSGSNFVAQNLTLVNAGSNQLMWGNGNPDSVGQNLTISNTGDGSIYFAQNQAGHFVGGNITATNSGTGNNTLLYLANAGASSLQVDGNVALINNATSNSSDVRANSSGSLVVGGDLTLTNNPTGNNNYVYVSASNGSLATIGGVTRVLNSGGVNISNTYLGSAGSVIFNDSLIIWNNSDANTSVVYCGLGNTSTNSYNEDIVVESFGTVTDGVTFGQNGGSNTLASGQTLTIGSNGFSTGTLYFRNFTQVGNTPQAITLSGNAYFDLLDANWGGNVSFIGPRFRTTNTRYNGAAYLEKTGSLDDVSSGGNVIIGSAELVNSGTRYFLMGNGNPDSLLSDAIFTNSGEFNMYFAHGSAGNYIGGDATINMSTTGSGTDYFYLSTNTNSTLQIDGNLTVINNATADDARVSIAENGTVVIDGNFMFNNMSSGTNSYAYISNGGNANVIMNGTTTINHQPTGPTTHRFYFGESGDLTCNADVSIFAGSGAGNSEFYVNRAGTSVGVFNGNITLEGTTPNSDGIRFGEGNGSSTLSAGNTVSIVGGGFTQGQLYFRNFTQLGTTPQSLNIGGSGTILNLLGCTWNGDLDFNAPRTFVSSSVFNGDFDFEKTGATNDISTGGNTYNGDVIFRNSGTGYQMIPNNVADDFNGNLTIIQTGTGQMLPSFNSSSTLSGDLTINTTTALTIGASNGRLIFDGNSAQSINDAGISPTLTLRRAQLNKPSDTLTLNAPVEIQTDMIFTSGVLKSDITNVLRFRDNASVSGASNASFVDGHVEKVGNDAFIFPVGDSLYRPISISNPASTVAVFRAKYHNANPGPAYPRNAVQAPIDHASTREYWDLDRLNTTNGVVVTLSWGANSGGVDNLSDLVVGHWNSGSSLWTSEGNGGTTGTTASGTISSAGAVTTFSPFTLASITANNPLPVELLFFNALHERDQVRLTWQTASEINNDYFDIERSKNGYDFETIEQANGAGNSNVVLNYETFDESPLNGISYYRLKQVDFDGTTAYSELKQINRVSESDINVSVFESQITINYGEISDQFEIALFDMDGRLVYAHQDDVLSNETVQYQLSGNLAAGIYLLNLSGQANQFSIRLFIP